jgi:hypothetical protein
MIYFAMVFVLAKIIIIRHITLDMTLGFKFYMTDPPATYHRDGMRIHHDEGDNGTAGCIGLITTDQTVLRQCRAQIRRGLNHNITVTANVNFTGNPNYARPATCVGGANTTGQ